MMPSCCSTTLARWLASNSTGSVMRLKSMMMPKQSVMIQMAT